MITATREGKRECLRIIRKCLEVAGTLVPWEEIEDRLREMPHSVLAALAYRIQQARSDAYNEGERAGYTRGRDSHS